MTKVVIIGGGPAGCATALALQQHGIADTLVIEAGRYDAIRIGESIPPDIGLFFAKVGIEDAFKAEAHEPCLGSCSAWGSSRLGFNDFIVNPHGHGWHLDRQRFEIFLAREVESRGARILKGTRFEKLDVNEAGDFVLSVTDAHGRRSAIQARFVVDASGARAVFSRRLGAKRRFLDQLVGVAGFITLSDDKPFSQLTMLEAVDYGWWYAAKLPGGRVAVVVASDPKLIKQRKLNQFDEWKQHLSQTIHLSSEFRNLALCPEKLIVVPVASDLLDPIAGQNWLAAGDAASSFDPISSQGIYKAFSNGIDAADAIARHFAGDHEGLRLYGETVRSQFSDYVRNRNYFYSTECRWEDSEFWSRRQARTKLNHLDPA